jgi:hypothetical protein
MQANHQRWLQYTLLAGCFAGSGVTLYALFALGAPRWTLPINVMSLACLFLALSLQRLKA